MCDNCEGGPYVTCVRDGRVYQQVSCVRGRGWNSCAVCDKFEGGPHITCDGCKGGLHVSYVRFVRVNQM